VLVYVDFDSTLFDTQRFGEQMFQMVADRTDIPLEQLRAERKDFYVTVGPLHTFDYDRFVTRYGLDAEEMWQRLDEMLGQEDFLYGDSIEFIQALRRDGLEPHILSFGEEHFQRVKIESVLAALAGEGSPLPQYTVVMQPKAQYIAEHHAGQRGVLVDDVPDQGLPAGFTEMHLQRAGHKGHEARPQGQGGVIVVSDLVQAYQAIRSL
jgi:hypothetical protein